jgi:DNA-binding NarL/FixJ family response regulator
VRVLVADDDALVRSALSMVLDAAAGVVLVGQVADGDEVPAAVAVHAPDVVLMDIRMPRVDGLTATELLRRRPGAPEVIVLTTFDVDDYVLRALRVGAAGFLLKDTPPADIVAAVHKVMDGEAMLSPTIIRRLIQLVTAEPAAPSQASGPRSEQLLARLTEREREVAVAVGHGMSNAEIGAAVYLSVATVKAYVSRVLAKLELTNRVQVALLVHDAGLTGDR